MDIDLNNRDAVLAEVYRREKEYLDGIEAAIPNTRCRDGECHIPDLFKDMSDAEIDGGIKALVRPMVAGTEMCDARQYRQFVWHLIEERLTRRLKTFPELIDEPRVTQEEFNEALDALENAQPDIDLKIPAIHLFVLIGSLQLALRHPIFPPTSGKIVNTFISEVRDRFAENHPQLAKLIDQGNNPALDVEAGS